MNFITSYTEALETDLDPAEMLPLRSNMAMPRGAVLAVLAFLDLLAITDVRPPQAPPAPPPDSVVRWCVDILKDLEPRRVEEDAIDRCPVGGGKGSLTAAVIGLCVEAIEEAARGRS